MTADRPLIDIGDVRNLVCPRHETALARDSTVNAYAFPIEVFGEAMADPRLIEHCHAGTPEEDIGLVGPFLRSVAPVCEWITTEAVERAWAKARELGQGAKA